MTTSTTSGPRLGVAERLAGGIATWGFVAVTVALIVFFAITEPSFRTVDNVFGMLKFIAPVGIAGSASRSP